MTNLAGQGGVAGWTPGSREAIAAGCRCPVLDNAHGRGFPAFGPEGGVAFWINGECPLHANPTPDKRQS